MNAKTPPANPMGFWTPNIDQRGRIARAVTGLVLLAAAALAWHAQLQLPGIICGAVGIFSLYEAGRGWCIIKACRKRSER